LVGERTKNGQIPYLAAGTAAFEGRLAFFEFRMKRKR